jgi:SpoVK/Ycf46/Vps4 family AAA+-type ATPase
VLDGLSTDHGKPAELLKRVEARCITEPPNSLWHAMRHYLLARTSTDRHTAFAHLRNAVDDAWPYGASPLLTTILEDAARTAAELEAWGAEESYLESMFDVQKRSFGENSAEHLRARFRLAVCHSRRYDVRACRQELMRLRKLVLTRYPDDAAFDGEIGAELARLAGPEEAEALETLDRRAALDEALRELDALIGLAEVKRHIRRLVAFLAVSRERERAGLPRVQRGFHFVFLGPPGTGKTTVARLIGRIFWALELLPTDTTVEAGRVDLVGGYIGQTAIKTEELVKRALDGVLFVDEAYALQNEAGNDFGQEAVAELIKHMENDRDRLVVILAGYTREMELMLEMNPGLASRVNEQLYFPSYDDAELEQIFRHFCAQSRYELSAEAEQRLPQVIAEMRKQSGKSFGNAREIRNLFEDAVVLQAARLQGIPERDEAALRTLGVSDLAGVGEARPSSRSIGFTS